MEIFLTFSSGFAVVDAHFLIKKFLIKKNRVIIKLNDFIKQALIKPSPTSTQVSQFFF